MCRGGMVRETGGGVGERRGWLGSKSNGGRRGRSEGLERVTGRTRESPERDWNQYVEARMCPWRHMRVSVPGETKHASIYPPVRGSERRRVSRTLLWSNPRGRVYPLWMCDRVRGIRLCETLLEFLIGRCLWSHGEISEKIYFSRKSWFDHWDISAETLARIKKKKSIFLVISNIIMLSYQKTVILAL